MTEPINTPPAAAPTQDGHEVTPASGAVAASSTAPVPAAPRENPEPVAAPVRSRLPAITGLIAALVLLADQGAKYLAVDRLTGRGRVDVLGDLFGFRLIRNSGAAFSIGTGATWLLTAVALVVVVVIIRISRRLGSRGWTIALGLVLGGALGNLSDRLFRAPSFFHGHVVDFLELPHWPIFNLADVSIDTGAVLIALLSLRGIGIDGQRLSAAPSAESEPAPTEGSAAPND